MAHLTIRDLSPEVQEKLAATLDPNESVHWICRPIARHAWCDEEVMAARSRLARAGIVLFKVAAGLLLAPFLVAGAALIEEIVGGNVSAGGIVIGVALSPFLFLIGFASVVLATTPLRRILDARRRIYVLTERRACVIHEYRNSVELTSFEYHRVQAPVALRTLRSGIGDVIFESHGVRVVGEHGTGNAYMERGFTAIPEAVEAAQLMADLRDQWLSVADREYGNAQRRCLEEKLAAIKDSLSD